MNRHYTFDINVNFSRPLRIVLEVKSDAAGIREQTEKLADSTDSLEKAVSDNQPKEEPKP